MAKEKKQPGANDGAWKKLTSFDGNPIFDFDGHKKGASIIGAYKGSRTIEKVDSLIHTIVTDNGVFDFWGTGQLNFMLKDIPADTEIKIVYCGKENATVTFENKKGKEVTQKKAIHKFEVYTKK
jgi:hypothetical protein